MEQTDRSQRGGGWGRQEEINQRIYMHIYRAHGHRQQCGEGLVGQGAGRQKGGKGRTSVIESTITKKKLWPRLGPEERQAFDSGGGERHFFSIMEDSLTS